MTVSVPKPTVISAGRTYADLIFGGLHGPLRTGTETYCNDLSFHPGGGAFITAAHLAAYGVDAHLMSSLPAAPFADPLRARIRDLGVDISASRDAPAGTDPQITVAMVERGDRTFLTRRDGPALPNGYADVLAASNAGHLHIGELATLAECPDLVQLARNAGMTISLDCGWDPSVYVPQSAILIREVDVFLPNRAETEALQAAGLTQPFSELDVVKLGADGARASWTEGTDHQKGPAVPVVDPTGAGDAFNAGFLESWLRGLPISACLSTGNDAGARAVSCAGGAGGLEQVEVPTQSASMMV